MPIKLKPEYVGGRVLLSDGEVGFVASHDKRANEYTIKGDGFYFDAEQDDTRVTLLLDAPNPLDVPVPEWCGMITLWRGSGKRHRLRPAGFLFEQDWDEWLTVPHGWSPAPGQMPPREDA